MRPHRFVAVVVVTLVACVNIAVTIADSKMIAPDFPTKQLGLTTKRLLRVDETADERAGVGALGLEKVTEGVKFAMSNIKIKMDVRAWLKNGQSADSVGKLLILDKKVDSVLSNPNFNTLAAYISKFNAKYPSNKVSIIDVLTRRYGDAQVSNMLVAAKKVKGTRERAKTLQDDLVEGWLNTEKTADDVFKILKLDDALTNPFGSRNMEVWFRFMNMYNWVNPGRETTLLQTVSRVYGGDERVATVLYISKYHFGSGKVARSLETALFRKWFTEGKSVETIMKDVFKISRYELPRSPYSLILDDYRTFYQFKSAQ